MSPSPQPLHAVPVTIERMDKLFSIDPLADGIKGLVFIGDKVLVYRRDGNTKIYPYKIDLPGGGIDRGETPFEAFNREVKEEFGIDIAASDIVYMKHYPALVVEEDFGSAPIGEYFPVVKLGGDRLPQIRFGQEGLDYSLVTLEEYLWSDDAIPIFQTRAAEYAKSLE